MMSLAETGLHTPASLSRRIAQTEKGAAISGDVTTPGVYPRLPAVAAR